MNKIDRTGWKKMKFGDVCSNLNVATQDAGAMGIDRYVGLEHIETGNLHISSWGNVADGTTFTKTFKPGHVLFGKRRAYLKKAAVSDFKGLCSSDILVFEANEKIIEKRLLPFLVSSDGFFDFAVQTSAGSLSPRTKFQDLAKFEFLLPPKDKQTNLADLFWAADELIKRRSYLLDILHVVKANFIDKWIAKLGKENDTKIKQLDEIGSFKNGINKSKEEFGHGYPFVNLLDVFGKETVSKQDFSLVNASQSELQNFELKKGDVLFIRSSVKPEGVGLTSLITEDLENTVFSGFLIRFRQEKKLLLDKYLQYCFSETTFRTQLLKNSTVSANTNINQVSLSKLRLPIPSIEKQSEFIMKLEQIASQITVVDQELKKIRQIQKQLINQIFSA